ncbi:MAG TPA: hypothetical protein VG435_19070 [Acidimicrobiales bacterium]|nr:hypothetical protein [Acidimicrobiales bacterium]
MPGPVAAPSVVRLEDLRVGDLLAEGGEGRVHLLPRQPHLLLKSYRQPADRSHLDGLVAWPDRVTAERAGLVRTASSWPCSVVAGPGGQAAGMLMPRAPRRFSVRHKDGHSRLASLSYLTADPQHRAVAYGLILPPPASAERVGLVYALARLLAAFEAGDPAVGHGDLSTKNVLWSLQRGPEIFVIDCDNCDLYGPDQEVKGTGLRRRAMTPNWNDPAVARGENPTAMTDRYSLALIFLRIVGAANFPIQTRQRGGDRVEIRFPAPAGPLLEAGAPVWDLCARALTLREVGARPAASDWLGPLEGLLDDLGGADLMRSVWAAQGGGAPSPTRPPSGSPPADVAIIPEPAAHRGRSWSRVSPAPRFGGSPVGAGGSSVAAGSSAAPGGFGYATVALGRPNRPHPASAQQGAAPVWVRPSSIGPAGAGPGAGPGRPGGASAGLPSGSSMGAPPGGAPGSKPPSPWLSSGATAPIWPEVREQLVRFLHWWVGLHRALLAALAPRGRRSGRIRAVVFCLAIDFMVVVLAGAAIGLVVSPIIVG